MDLGCLTRLLSFLLFGHACAMTCVLPGRNVVATLTVGNGGPWGIWGSVEGCPLGSFVSGYRMRFLWYFDDTAANYVHFKCRDFHNIPGRQGVSEIGEGTGLYGTWGTWSNSCPVNSAICGLTTKIQERQGSGDDTALNDVKFCCCRD